MKRYLQLDNSKEILWSLSIATGCLVSAIVLPKYLKKWTCRRQLSKKREERQEKLKKAKIVFGNYLEQNLRNGDLENTILELNLIELVKKLRSGELKPQHVLLAYQRKAYEVDEKYNCVVEFFYPDFTEIDLSGPFAGLPISIKDNFGYKGYDSCIGCSEFIDDAMKEDCSPVKVLKKLGAVPFCKTAVPQTMMTVLSSNPIDGTVFNPVNVSKSPGGSSSGEGALISGGGSLLGLGTDIGGSIRLPAAWCGIQGFKPTSGRLTYQGFRSAGIQKMVLAIWGPLARDVESLIFFMQQFCGEDTQYVMDPSVPSIGFDSEMFCDTEQESIDYFPRCKSKLKIGFYIYDNAFKAVPAAERAVLETKRRLEQMGHQLIEWNPPTKPDQFEFLQLYYQGVANDGGQFLRRVLQHDVYGDSITLALVDLSNSTFWRKFNSAWNCYFGDKDYGKFLKYSFGFANINELWKFGKILADHRQKFIESWLESGFDAVICPPVACPAVDVHPSKQFSGCLSYIFLYNLLNFPAGTISVTKVIQDDIDKMSSYPRTSMWHCAVADMQMDTVGLPVSVQCATLPWRDELCLRVMMDIQTALQL